MTLHRGAALPVDLKIIEQALLDKAGSIAAAARALGVRSDDLRRLVASRPLLADTIYEGTERALDAAEQRCRRPRPRKSNVADQGRDVFSALERGCAAPWLAAARGGA